MVDNSTSVRGVTVYYLKHAKAAAVADALVQIMGAASGSGGAASSAQAGPDPFGGFGGPFGAFGGPFGAFGGNMGGGFGGNQGGGRRGRGGQDSGGASDSAAATTSVAKPQTGQGGSLATGPVKITADQRLNALLVQANRTDLDSIEELLKILDQKESPEDIALAPKPRMIPVQYSSAEELAGVVKQVYADRMIEAAGSGQQGGGPFFMMQMAAARARQAGANSDVARMSVGVDARTNSLIVAAPDNLFEEVRQLVEQLDVAAGDQNQTVHVVTLHRSSPSAVEQALAAIAGSSVQVNHTVPQPGTGAATGFQPQFQGGDFQRRGQYGGGMGQGQGYGRAYNQPGQGYGRGMMNQPGQGYGRGMMNQPGQGYGRGMMNQPAGFNQPGQGQGYGRGMTNQTGGFNQPGQGGNQMGGQGGQRGGR
jgi:hypothetical protein